MEKRKQLSSRQYLGYVLGVFVLGGVIFVYEMNVDSEPLLQVSSPASTSVSTSTPAAISVSSATSTPIVTPKTASIQPLSLIVVRTDADKERGLGGRASLPANQGMLFVFDQPASEGIWMKDMQFSIDIISLDAHFAVVHIESNVSPLTYPKAFVSPLSTKYIIESNAGYAQKNNIKVGDVLDFARVAVNN